MEQNSISKKTLRISLTIVSLVAIFIAVYFTVQYIQSRRTIEVTFSNVTVVKLVEFRTLKPIETLKKSGEKVTISKNIRYKLLYTGEEGYASGDVSTDTSDKINIKPYYSVEKLDTLLTNEAIDLIHNKIKNEYTDVLNEYTIQVGKLYHFGDWYSTTLVYNGEYSDTSDTFTVVAKKTNQDWDIIGDPSISFDRFNNPSIPIDILREINS